MWFNLSNVLKQNLVHQYILHFLQFVSNWVLIAEMTPMNFGSAKDPLQQTGSYDSNTNFSTPNIGLLRYRIWWRHQMETFTALLAICAGNSPVSGEFPAQRPVTRSFDVFFDLRLNKPLSKQSYGWWLETLSRPLWRHCNVLKWYSRNSTNSNLR